MHYTEIKSVNARVGIWTEIPKERDFNTSKLQREEMGKKQLIAQLFPNEPPTWAYEDIGKPYFQSRPEKLSFSHSENVFACQVSLLFECGIDIQHYKDKILRLPDKFLNEAELDFVHALPTEDKLKALTAMWSCKEVLYKIYGKGFIDYTNQFHIQPFSINSGVIDTFMDTENTTLHYPIQVEFNTDYVLAFRI